MVVNQTHVLMLSHDNWCHRFKRWFSEVRRKRLILQVYNTVRQNLARPLDNMDDTGPIAGQYLPRVELLRDVRLLGSSRKRAESLAVAEDDFAKEQTVSIHDRDSRHF